MAGPLEGSVFPLPVSCAVVVTTDSSDIVTATLNSTSQVTVTFDPDRTGLTRLLLTVTEVMLGTERKRARTLSMIQSVP